MSSFKKNGPGCCGCAPTSCLLVIDLPQVCQGIPRPGSNRWERRNWDPVYKVAALVDADGKEVPRLYPGYDYYDVAKYKSPFTATVAGANKLLTYGPDVKTQFDGPGCFPTVNGGNPDPRSRVRLPAPQILKYKIYLSFGLPYYSGIFFLGQFATVRPMNYTLNAGGVTITGSTVYKVDGPFGLWVDVPFGDGFGQMICDMPPVDDTFYYYDQNHELQSTPLHWRGIRYHINFCYYFCYRNIYDFAPFMDEPPDVFPYPQAINCMPGAPPYDPYVGYYGSDPAVMAQMAGPFAMMAGPPVEAGAAAGGDAPPALPRVGFLAPCLKQGGAEAWQLTLADATAGQVEWMGCAVLAAEDAADPGMLAATRGRMPVAFGSEAARALAARCDVLISWALLDLGPMLASIPTPPAVIFPDHFAHDRPYDDATRRCLESFAHVVGVSELSSPGFAPFMEL